MGALFQDWLAEWTGGRNINFDFDSELCGHESCGTLTRE
jgi:hypothetical protein